MTRPAVSRLVAALLAGGAAYGLTREPFVGLLAAAGVWFFWRPGSSTPEPKGRDPAPAWTRRTREERGVEVVCKQATAERQEWVSVRTGRLYDVLAPNGPADPKPGDRAFVVTTPSGYRISRENEESAES